MISQPASGKHKVHPACTLAYKHCPKTETNTRAINPFTLEAEFHRNLNKQTGAIPAPAGSKLYHKKKSLCGVPIKRKTALVKVKS